MTSLCPTSQTTLGSLNRNTASTPARKLFFGSKTEQTRDKTNLSGNPESEPRVTRGEVARYLMKSLFTPKRLLRHVVIGGGIGVFIGLFSPLMTLTIPAGIGGSFLLDLGARLFAIATMFSLDPNGQHSKDLKIILKAAEKEMEAARTGQPATA